MKEIFNKHKVGIIVSAVLILFIVLSLLIDNNKAGTIEMKDKFSSWKSDTEKDEYYITVVAQESCRNCTAFKPILQKVIDEYEIENVYWFEVDTGEFRTHEDYYTTLINTYELTGYKGTPYTFITKNGEMLDYISGYTTEDVVIEFLKENNVIE